MREFRIAASVISSRGHAGTGARPSSGGCLEVGHTPLKDAGHRFHAFSLTNSYSARQSLWSHPQLTLSLAIQIGRTDPI
jgi:hypothetical protein